MRNRLVHIATILAAIIMAATSCDFRPLYIEGETPVEVLVMTDWTQLGGDPEGASIYFYPEDATKTTRVFKTNSVAKTIVKVPSGYYTVMVFNRTVDEFGTMKFAKMDTLSTAKAILEDKLFTWVGRADTIGRTVYEPEEIVVGRTDHFYVRTESERTVKEWTKADSEYTVEIDSVRVRPLRMIYTGNISVKIKGIQNIQSVRAYLTGMAGSDYMATRSAGDTLATHVLEKWTLAREETDYTRGYVKTSFNCFGLPERYMKTRTPEDNRLVLQFRLVDEETELQYIFNVGDNIQQIEKELVVNVVIETDESGNQIVLPDVKPKGGSASGFDVSFKDWEDPIDVPVGI